MQKYDENKKKWEKQSWDTKNPYDYFTFFLDWYAKNKWDTAKAKAKTCEYFNKKYRYIENISAKFEWLERAEAYKNYLDEEQRKEFEIEYKERCKETFMQIRATSQIVGKKLGAMVSALKDANGDAEKENEVMGNITLPQLVQVLKLNQDIMNNILGIPDKREVSVSGNVAATVKQVEEDLTEKLSKLSPEKREEYLALQAELNDEPAD